MKRIPLGSGINNTEKRVEGKCQNVHGFRMTAGNEDIDSYAGCKSSIPLLPFRKCFFSSNRIENSFTQQQHNGVLFMEF